MKRWVPLAVNLALLCFIVASVCGMILASGGLGGGHAAVARSAETGLEQASGRHIFLSPSETNQPNNFKVMIEGVHFPANDSMVLQTDASFGSTPACESNTVDGTIVVADSTGTFAVTRLFLGCLTNTVGVTLNDDGHLYRSILDID